METILDFDATAITVGELVTADIRSAEVFKRLGIDFCCNGKRTLAEACDRAGIELPVVLEKLERLPARERLASEQFDQWEPDFLADYILNVHHRYLYQNLPFIQPLVQKVATKHGDRYPAMREVLQTFEELSEELVSHLQKEEEVLFPTIKSLVAAKQEYGDPTRRAFLNAPITVMEHEHDNAGTLLFRLRELTNNYTPAEDACNSHRLMLAKLAELEADLMQHIHLENNILFPKALELEQEVVLS
ncbi:iron-sulfur cluster repair di-iron protein [Telluribacter sp. SYSU D00476]|uniref:iron-sulfur cluster repair di-iron protein n=1 Tax=Telluribacter sp. SYSU D00476 TaxID=2811430 RepID=UPI001FF52B34|nr:iron-sulfur cluster repair di-iron protein [Telluribacter sp. SYSU D00476]